MNSNKQNKKWINQQRLIEVIGPNPLHNDLFAHYLQQETGIECFWATKLNHLCHNFSRPSKILIMWDCSQTDLDQLWNQFKPGQELYLPHCYVALFNVQEEKDTQNNALRCGIRGIFNIETPARTICKGVLAIMKGQMWFSRNSMSQCIEEYENNLSNRERSLAYLTSREREILLRIASGEKNKAIANALCISPYTVKTHVQNIYKKIDVTSRLEATIWVARNIPAEL